MLLESTTSYRAVAGRYCTAAAAKAVSLKYLTLNYLHTALTNHLIAQWALQQLLLLRPDKVVLYQQPSACVLANCCARSRTAVAQSRSSVTGCVAAVHRCTSCWICSRFLYSGAWQVRDPTVAELLSLSAAAHKMILHPCRQPVRSACSACRPLPQQHQRSACTGQQRLLSSGNARQFDDTQLVAAACMCSAAIMSAHQCQGATLPGNAIILAPASGILQRSRIAGHAQPLAAEQLVLHDMHIIVFDEYSWNATRYLHGIWQPHHGSCIPPAA